MRFIPKLMKQFVFVEIFNVRDKCGSKPQPLKVFFLFFFAYPLMPVLCYCLAVPSPPSDGDAGRPDEDTFGVSFLPNDVDETAAKDVALGLNRKLLCGSTQI